MPFRSLGVWTVTEGGVGSGSQSPAPARTLGPRRERVPEKSNAACNAPELEKGLVLKSGIPPETDAKCDPTPPETYFSAEERVPEKMRRSDSDEKVEGGGRSTRKALGFPGILLFRPDWLNLDWYRFFGIVRADGAERHSRGAPSVLTRGGVHQATVSSMRARPVHVQLRSWAAKCLQHGAVDTYEWPARAV
jgi:hypothetical protein